MNCRPALEPSGYAVAGAEGEAARMGDGQRRRLQGGDGWMAHPVRDRADPDMTLQLLGWTVIDPGEHRHAPAHVGRIPRGRRVRPRSPRPDAADRLAAAGRAHRRRGLGQAREPHAHRRLQGAGRPRLHGRSAPAWRGRGRDRRHSGQSRPEHRLRRDPARPCFHPGGAGGQCRRQERGDERIRWRAGGARRRFRGRVRSRPDACGRARPGARAFLRRTARAGRRHLCAGALHRRARSRRGLRAEWGSAPASAG